MDVQTLMTRLASEAAQDARMFPTSASGMLRVRRALDDPDADLAEIARLLKAEPLLAAHVVAMANSVVYNRSGREIADLRNAVARLGLATLRNLVVSALVRQMENLPASPADRAIAHQLWEHTAHVAALANVLARRIGRFDPEVAFFAGLVHEVGSFYLVARAPEFGGLSPELLDAWHEGGGMAAVGRAVLVRLDVPATALGAIEALWAGYLQLPPASLGDLLLLADELSPVPSPLEVEPSARSGELGRIQAELGETSLQEILDEVAREIADLRQAIAN